MPKLARNAARAGVSGVVLLLLGLTVTCVKAQDARLNVAAGLVPGVGVMVVHSSPTLFIFTQELTVYGDYKFTGEDRLLVAAGVGGGIQLMRLAELIQNRPAGPFGLDAGMRVGPSFFYTFGSDTAEEDARSFRVMFDPFVRGQFRTGGGRMLFAELGAQAPGLRVGISTGL